MRQKACGGLTLLVAAVATAAAVAVGHVQGTIRDPQGRPVAGVAVTLEAVASSWSQQVKTDAAGLYTFNAVPVGAYVVTLAPKGFSPAARQVDVTSGSASVVDITLAVAGVSQQVEVTAAPVEVDTRSSAAPTLVSRQDIARTPGASDTNSLAMITTTVPGATIVHDQLHVRGGHQVSWLIDGVPIPNTNIASNVGPQVDPKDIDYLEVRRGSYSADYGDRTYGVFDIVPRTGFERDREVQLVASFGQYRTTNDQVSVGSHEGRWAYYASLTGYRSNLGLMTPDADLIHDSDNGLGGFGSLIGNATARDQLRLVGSARRDDYQIPNTAADHAAGIRDLDRERDTVLVGSWVHTFGSNTVLTVSPFFHFNRADFEGGPDDTPLITTDNRASHYGGGQVEVTSVGGRHNLRAGFDGFVQRDRTFFGLTATDGSGLAVADQVRVNGHLVTGFVEDQIAVADGLTVNAGVRLAEFSGLTTERKASPRVGAAYLVPRLGWVLRGFYGRYYQPPPLDTVAGPLEAYAVSEGVAFLPLSGERDRQWQAGVTIPVRGWTIDTSAFRTMATNFFDHDALGNSNLFLPLTIAEARIRGAEAEIRTPTLWSRVRLRASYSYQIAQGRGAVTGGLTDFEAPEDEYFYLDHDQRQTFSTVVSVDLPRQAWTTATINAGSGFLMGDGPDHLPAYGTVDLAAGAPLGKQWEMTLSALNVTNHRYFVDQSNTFGGTHFAYPRRVSLEVRYRFHY
jgi:outer membrane cobalamin receptor